MTATTTRRPTGHLSRDERVARGRAARKARPRADHAALPPTVGRTDPVSLLEEQATSRVPELVPIRYGRMLTSAFAFYRGAALIMANDLATVPRSGLDTQLCGDAHLSNFGVFGTAERRLVFDINDFDETAPGPFEWDVKRLATSLELAGRSNGYHRKVRRGIVLTAVTAYREAMRDFAGQTNLAVWYARIEAEQIMAEVESRLTAKSQRRTEAGLAKARSRDSAQALARLTTMVDGHPRIRSEPPLVVPIEELFPDLERDVIFAEIEGLLRSYRTTLAADRRAILDQFRLQQVARKVVGVGSVGTRAWILLLEGVDGSDHLFLQAKEAGPSVLEGFTARSRFTQHGQRVVVGQQLMQASSDIFLGWQRSIGFDGASHDYYVRQLRDWKGSVDVDKMVPDGMRVYARLCGWTLARAHARAGDRVAIAAYLGGGDAFDQAVADFAAGYADVGEGDHAALGAAVEAGRVEATPGV